ncbi:MAG: cysteine desulfurase family protein [Oscillospiraceae bacterium]|nr:cysteine desulfurase family protein [Oscillospiraceae bacterium]
MIYLDYSANTPSDPAVLKAFCRAEQQFCGNPNSTHCAGQAAQQEMARVTDSIAELLGISPAEIIFTSGASESNNLAIKGVAQASRHIGRHIISTPLEHSSVGGSLTALQNAGHEIDLLDIGRNGTVDLQQLQELLRKDTVLVALCAVDSELGTVQPIAQVAEILRGFPQCRFHVDATQAVGKTALVWEGVDTMSIAPHKFYGLNGSGLLLKRQGVAIEPQIHGGSSTTLYRSGTPALSLAASTETALRLALTQQSQRVQAVQSLNAALRAFLAQYPAVRINSPQNAVPHILNLSVQGVKGTAFQQALSKQGVCVSVKSACSSDGTPSKAVFAVSRDRKNALSSWRISLSHLTTAEELEHFFEIFGHCYHALVKE